MAETQQPDAASLRPDAEARESALALAGPDDSDGLRRLRIADRALRIERKDDVLFTSMSEVAQADTSPAGDDDSVWEDAASLQELLTLPLGIVEKMIEVVV
jgi:hypothetical protein